MSNSKILIYDGTFNGFLTCVYKAFDENIKVADIQKNETTQNGLFSEVATVFTKMDCAKRVWEGIQRKNHIAIRNIYFAFLSETKHIEMLLFRYIKKLFSPTDALSLNFTDEAASKISTLAKTVGKEKRLMETSLPFQTTKDQIQFASIAPDSDILPLISRHYRFLYADRPWIIYDRKRNYGLYYNSKSVALISLDSEVLSNTSAANTIAIKTHIVRKLRTQAVRRSNNSYVREREAV